jgi:hypothetical protein
MITAPQPVNGLAPEILFFLKEMNVKEFAGRVLARELKKGRSLGWRPVQDTAEGIFGRWNAEDNR